MTADAVPAAIVPLRPAWRSLLWTVPFTVLLDVVDLLATGASGERSSGPDRSADGPWTHRARIVARP